jgi:hypothetical protein
VVRKKAFKSFGLYKLIFRYDRKNRLRGGDIKKKKVWLMSILGLVDKEIII